MSSIHLPRTRRGRVATVLVLIVAVAAVAYAVFTARAPIEGDVQAGSFAPQFQTATKAQTSTASCQTPAVSNGRLQFKMVNAFPGDVCVIDANIVSNTGGVMGKIVGIDFTGLPAGWTAEINQGCGLTFQSGSPATVRFTVTMTNAAASDGGTYPLGGLAGIVAQPANDAPANPVCPVFNGG